jgi:hypothetical protein
MPVESGSGRNKNYQDGEVGEFIEVKTSLVVEGSD